MSLPHGCFELFLWDSHNGPSENLPTSALYSHDQSGNASDSLSILACEIRTMNSTWSNNAVQGRCITDENTLGSISRTSSKGIMSCAQKLVWTGRIVILAFCLRVFLHLAPVSAFLGARILYNTTFLNCQGQTYNKFGIDSRLYKDII